MNAAVLMLDVSAMSAARFYGVFQKLTIKFLATLAGAASASIVAANCACDAGVSSL
jgi:hypothetical protein